MNKRKIGDEYEKIAAAYLENNGYIILEKNYRCRNAEIDIIAKNDSYICFEIGRASCRERVSSPV